MALSLDTPIEDLKLSNRVRNVLHLSGLHTIGSLLECDYKTALRGFGPGARAELACALESHGFAPPANLMPSDSDDFIEDVSKLFGQMEASFQKWSARAEYYETRLQDLTSKVRDYRGQLVGELTEHASVSPAVALAREFRTRLAAIRAASATLREVTKLPPAQREMVALVEEESLRLSLRVCRLLEMLPSEKPVSGSLSTRDSMPN